MTLTTSLEGSDGLVCVTDSRGTFGDPRGLTAQNDTMQKLYPTTKYAVVMISGANSQGAMVMDEVRGVIAQSKIEGATNVMQKIREVARMRYNDWFPNFPMQAHPNIPLPARPALGFLIAGYDLESNGPTTRRTYALISSQDYAPNLFDFGFGLAGVAQYATFLLNRLYVRGMTVSKLLPLAAYITTETASQDAKVGGPLQMCTITPSAGVMVLTPEQVEEIVKSNEDKSKKLKELFGR
jgi:20S proteasome alpha/beta subunit